MTISIPAFHVSDASQVRGLGEVFIASRQVGGTAGVFSVELGVNFAPLGASDYPTGSVLIKADLSDGAIGTFKATSIELINSHGRHNPTVFLTGRCTSDIGGNPPPKGLRYWLMIANNRRSAADPQGTPDVVGFAIHDRTGVLIAYGTGPVRRGDFDVAPV